MSAVETSFAVLEPSSAIAQMMPEGWPMHGWDPVWGVWHMLFPLFWLIVLVAAVAAVIKWLWPETGRYNSGQRALDTLSERYAKGEIEREEYLRRRQDILGA